MGISAAKPKSLGLHAPAEGAHIHSSHNVSCLLVEDVKISQHIAKVALTKEQFAVDVASNGASAVSMYAPGKYKVILMDIGMEGMSLSFTSFFFFFYLCCLLFFCFCFIIFT